MTKTIELNFEKALQYEQVIRNAVGSVLVNYDRERDSTLDDLSQEVLIKVAEGISSFKEERAKIETWIYSIAKNHTVSFLRKKQYDPKNHTDFSLHDSLECSSSPETELLKKEQYEFLMNAFSKMATNQRKALSLFINDHSYVEIANTMDLSLSSVKALIFRAREFLKKELHELVA